MEKSGLSQLPSKRDYGPVVKIMAKNIGFESMKLIEEFSRWKEPGIKTRTQAIGRVKKVFSTIKDSINRKLIQITDERSRQKSP